MIPQRYNEVAQLPAYSVTEPAGFKGTTVVAKNTAIGAAPRGMAKPLRLPYRFEGRVGIQQHRAIAAPPMAPPATKPSAAIDLRGMTAGASGEAFEAMSQLPTSLQLASSQELPASLATVALADTAPVPPAPSRQSRFYLGIVVAPDVSTVKFADVQSPLPNVGLVVEYRLTSRLRLSTGLLRSTKHYTARREDYDWGAYASRIYQRDFRTVDGSCTVLDVPLNLRYDALVRPQYRVFGSAGLSSYFMQRERYSYAWVENNMPNQWTREAVNENHHLLSVLNLSAGYERSLTDHWSLQAEPYLKLPLSGVGAGKVRLASGGVFVGIKYSF